MMNTKGSHGWSRMQLCTLTHCSNSCSLSPRSSCLKEHFRELRHPSIWRVNIDFQVTGRRMEESADEEAKCRVMRCVFFISYYYSLFFCFCFLMAAGIQLLGKLTPITESERRSGWLHARPLIYAPVIVWMPDTAGLRLKHGLITPRENRI